MVHPGNPEAGGREDPDARGVLADDALADGVGLADVLGLADAVGLGDELGLADGVGLADVLGLADAVGLGDELGLADEVRLADGTEAVSAGTGAPRPRLTPRTGRWLPAAPDPLSGLRAVAWRKGFSGF
jgi:UDP-3-O-[3-hydroxymyristoyl] glucosamine N-acyltransferase